LSAAGIGIGLQVAGSLGGAIGSIFGGKSEKRAAEARARQLEIQAQEILRRSELNQERIRKEGESFTASQASGFAKGGIDLGTGSPLLVIAETALQFDKDIAEERRQSEFDAAQVRAGAAAARRSGRDSARAGVIGAISSGFRGGARVAGFLRPPKQPSGGKP